MVHKVTHPWETRAARLVPGVKRLGAGEDEVSAGCAPFGVPRRGWLRRVLSGDVAGGIDRRRRPYKRSWLRCGTRRPTCVSRSAEGLHALLRQTPSGEDLARQVRNPLAAEPYVNIQNKNGQAKPYQVKQVLAAIDKLERKE